jgi:hypothetical protein
MRPCGSSTDINVLCKNQSSPAQSAQHHRLPLPVCSLMLIDTICSLQCMPLSPLLYAPDKKCEPSKASGQIETARGIQNTCLSGARCPLFFFFLLCSAPSSFEQVHPSIYLFPWVASVSCPFLSTSLPFDLVDSFLWPASYTPLFVAEVVVILNYKRGIVHGDFSLFSILHLCHWITPP